MGQKSQMRIRGRYGVEDELEEDEKVWSRG